MVEPARRGLQVVTGSSGFSIHNFAPKKVLARLLSGPHLYEVPGVLCGQQRQAAVIALGTLLLP